MPLKPLLAACGLVLSTASIGAVLAQTPAANPMAGMTRFTGTVTSASGNALVVQSRDGSDVQLTVPEQLNVMVREKGTVADLAAGKFVGCTAVKRADGLLHATECHIFPESMRGMGEGHNPMGPPNTTMTNGNVATMTNGEVASTSGGASATITVTYSGGQQTIEVASDTDITKMDAGTPALVKPGVNVSGAAKPAANGSPQVVFLSINR